MHGIAPTTCARAYVLHHLHTTPHADYIRIPHQTYALHIYICIAVVQNYTMYMYHYVPLCTTMLCTTMYHDVPLCNGIYSYIPPKPICIPCKMHAPIAVRHDMHTPIVVRHAPQRGRTFAALKAHTPKVEVTQSPCAIHTTAPRTTNA